jgi:hypothetical protein
MKLRRWITLYIAFGAYGIIGEILIGTFFTLLNRPLWTYYNGFHTSVESFFIFGLAGCIGLKIFILILRRNQKSVLTSLQ